MIIIYSMKIGIFSLVFSMAPQLKNKKKFNRIDFVTYMCSIHMTPSGYNLASSTISRINRLLSGPTYRVLLIKYVYNTHIRVYSSMAFLFHEAHNAIFSHHHRRRARDNIDQIAIVSFAVQKST